MIRNKKVLSLISSLVLVLTALLAIPIQADEFHTVRGDVYINGVIAPEGITVKISFDTGDETDLTESNGHYQIDFQGYDFEEGFFSVYYSGNWEEPENIKSVDIYPDIIGYDIDLYITPSSGGNGGNGGGGNGGGIGGGEGVSNALPIADASAGEPYQGVVGEEITFDGSNSSDPDGEITNYTWDFGDGETGYGVNPTHSYDSPGEYTITLTVTDNVGATGTDETTANILIPNRSPLAPEVNGPQEGTKNTKYTYTAFSTDADNDSIQYNFNWDDGTDNTSEFVPNGTMVIQTHEWTVAGVYIISVEAFDNQTYSNTTQHIVLIDAHIVDDIGYITDDDADGTYDTFHDTDVETALGMEDGKYLIDDDGDGDWDWIYDIETGELKEWQPPDEEDYTNIIILIIILIILLIIFSILLSRGKKGKKETTSKEPPKKSNKTTKKKK